MGVRRMREEGRTDPGCVSRGIVKIEIQIPYEEKKVIMVRNV
jgi:hypothetical protein